jgi:c-di-GMP-binding flagellar brake protein YcgR
MLIANDWNEEERRAQERYTLENYLCVIDRADNTLLGHIVDISAGGMKLLSDSPIPDRREYRLLLEISLNGGSLEKVAMTARSTWTDWDMNPGLYNTGFYFLWLSPEARLKIEQLIEYLREDQTEPTAPSRRDTPLLTKRAQPNPQNQPGTKEDDDIKKK